MYSTSTCPYCGAARMLLTGKGVRFDDINVAADAHKRAEMESESGRRSVPQIFIGDSHIGGYDELNALEKSGELDTLLASI